MNTPTHLVVAAVLLAKRGENLRNRAVLLGALAPDISIFVFYLWTKMFSDATEKEIWGTLYWAEPWQTVGAISNSMPLALLLLGVALWRRLNVLCIFALALLTHIFLDFPMHADDAHRHFWPLTDWRFHSPISYWDRSHHGTTGSLIELTVMVISIVILWRCFPAKWIRASLIIVGALYVIVGTYFYFSFS